MTFFELDLKITEAVSSKDLEKVLVYINSKNIDLDDSKSKGILLKKFPKLDDSDIELIKELI